MIIAIAGRGLRQGHAGQAAGGHYGLRHLDTGLIYRAIAKAMLDAGHALDDKPRAIAAARALDPAASMRKSSSAMPSGRRHRSYRHSRGALPGAGVPARFRPLPARRGARRP